MQGVAGGGLACADRPRSRPLCRANECGLAYKVRVKNLPDGLSALAFTRQQLDRLQIGADLQRIPWGSKTFKLPPPKLKT